MKKFEVTIQFTNDTMDTDHRVFIIEAENEDEACYKASEFDYEYDDFCIYSCEEVK